MNITKDLNKEIKRVVNNFNRKITRLEQLERKTDVYIPERISKKEITQKAGNIKEIKDLLNRYKTFTQKGSEQIINLNNNVKVSKYELKYTENELRKAKKKIQNEIYKLGNIEIKTFGKKQKVKIKESPTEQLYNLKAKQKALKSLSKIKDKGSFDRLQGYIEKELYSEREKQRFRQNYIDIFKKTADFYDFDKEKTKQVIEKLEKLNDAQFTALFNTDTGIKAVMDYYPDKKGNLPLDKKDVGNDVNDIYSNIFENIDIIMNQ